MLLVKTTTTKASLAQTFNGYSTVSPCTALSLPFFGDVRVLPVFF